jgi:hypothetical protein
MVNVQELLEHSAATATPRYMHTNLDSEHTPVAKLDAYGDRLVTVRTKRQQLKQPLSLTRAIS